MFGRALQFQSARARTRTAASCTTCSLYLVCISGMPVCVLFFCSEQNMFFMRVFILLSFRVLFGMARRNNLALVTLGSSKAWSPRLKLGGLGRSVVHNGMYI